MLPEFGRRWERILFVAPIQRRPPSASGDEPKYRGRPLALLPTTGAPAPTWIPPGPALVRRHRSDHPPERQSDIITNLKKKKILGRVSAKTNWITYRKNIDEQQRNCEETKRFRHRVKKLPLRHGRTCKILSCLKASKNRMLYTYACPNI